MEMWRERSIIINACVGAGRAPRPIGVILIQSARPTMGREEREDEVHEPTGGAIHAVGMNSYTTGTAIVIERRGGAVAYRPPLPFPDKTTSSK